MGGRTDREEVGVGKGGDESGMVEGRRGLERSNRRIGEEAIAAAALARQAQVSVVEKHIASKLATFSTKKNS